MQCLSLGEVCILYLQDIDVKVDELIGSTFCYT